jgi:hypothetical protein
MSNADVMMRWFRAERAACFRAQTLAHLHDSVYSKA